MVSPSSRRKSGSAMRPDMVVQLLVDGNEIDNPDEELRGVATQLSQLGLIRIFESMFVRCAELGDVDFPRSNRRCQGRVYLEEDSEDHFCCPECGRFLHPKEDKKCQFTQFRVEIDQNGVLKFLESQLDTAGITPFQVTRGVFRATTDSVDVFVCIIGFCADQRYLSRDWARTQPTCYVVIDEVAAQRMLEEEWIERVSLGDLATGQADLADMIEQVAESHPPSSVANMIIPIHTLGPRPRPAQINIRGSSDRWFAVEVTPETVLIEGEPVVAPQAETRYRVFRVLWRFFLKDVADGYRSDGFKVITLDELLDELSLDMSRQMVDVMSARRTLNRLQTDIMTTLRSRLGAPIRRDDIIETCRWEGQATGGHGYRLNPLHVMARPYGLR